MGEQAETWRRLDAIVDRTMAIADDITVAVVANKGAIEFSDSNDRATEYLSDSEASQLLTGLSAAGFRTRYFEGELAFISAVQADPKLGIRSSRLAVYNIAQSGTDPGRKSLVPSFCALHGLRTCNSNAYAVSLARNKLHTHAVLRRFGLPTPTTWAYRAGSGWLGGERPPEGQRLIAKACHESASIGLDAGSVGYLDAAYEAMLAQRSQRLAQPMVVQPLIAGLEIETPLVELDGVHHVLGPAVINLGGVDRLGDRVLDFGVVAYDDYGFSQPTHEHADAVGRIRRAAPAVCEVLGLNGFARVDYRVSDDGEIYAIDVATSPHIVWHSAFAHVFRQAGREYEAMMAAMIGVNAARWGWL